MLGEVKQELMPPRKLSLFQQTLKLGVRCRLKRPRGDFPSYSEEEEEEGEIKPN